MAALAMGSRLNPEPVSRSPDAESVPLKSRVVADRTSPFHASDESDVRYRRPAIASASDGKRNRRAHHVWVLEEEEITARVYATLRLCDYSPRRRMRS